VRRRNDLSSVFTFGGRVPATVGFLLAAMVVASLWGFLSGGAFREAALAPAAIWRGELWRLVTWPFFQQDPLSLVLAGLMIWTTGQQLSYAWSERRFAVRFLQYVLAAAVVSTLAGLVWDRASMIAHLGMWPVLDALFVVSAMMAADSQVSLFGVLPMTGRTFALLITGATVLFAVAAFRDGLGPGPAAFIPHLAAVGLAWIHVRGVSVGTGRGWRQAKRWWREREMKRRTRHLKVVRKNGSDGRSDWLN
jgi:membrane associated rhomboid family serine protease